MLRDLKGEKLTRPEITANAVLIVAGGSETTSTCLSAAIYHLCKTPRVLQKLKEDVRRTFLNSEDITLRATANMPYLKATIDESLRIFPVASYIAPRVTPKGGHVIDGELVPEGVGRRLYPAPSRASLTRRARHTSPWGNGTWAARLNSSTHPWNFDRSGGSLQMAAKRRDQLLTTCSSRSVSDRGIAWGS